MLDAQGKNLHFASAGGILPEMIVLKYQANQRIHDSVLRLDELFEVEINPNLSEIVSFPDDEMREIYLRDFIFFAKRGFYSFDRTYISDFNDPRYHLVASPLPNDINPESIHNDLLDDLKIDSAISVSPLQRHVVLADS